MAGDNWFRHSADETLPQVEHGDHISPKALGVTLLLIVFGIFAVILLLSAYFGSYYKNLRAERMEGVDGVSDQLLLYRSSAGERLNRAGWVNRADGIVHIPIEDAMEATVAFYSQPGRQAQTEWNGVPVREPLPIAITNNNNAAPQETVATDE